MKSPTALLRSLLTDVSRLNPGVKGIDRDVITINKRFENEGFGFLAKALPSLDAAILHGLKSKRFTCPIGFKTVKGGVIPRLFSGILCKVFDPLTGLLVEAPDLGALKDLRTVLMLHKKTRLSDEDEDILHQKAVNEFYQCDAVASQVVIPDRHDHLIGRVSKMLLNTLTSKDVQNARYKHGPGAVKEGYKANEKFAALYDAIRSDDVDLLNIGYWGIGESQIPSSKLLEQHDASTIRRDAKKAGSRLSKLPRAKRPVVLGDTDNDRASRSSAKLISVPKNSSSRRTITVEPLLKQFVQQGLNILLRESISECKILRNSLALSDQSINQKLALEGSLNDKWATIDLKSASDLLSVSLVKSVFRHQPQFTEYMMASRSPYVVCENKPTLTLGKFAGMGNALTFPVQSICFAVVCIAAILDSKGLAPTYWNVVRASRQVRVYGDDIIVRTESAHQCVDWLHAVGLKVNDKKSFLEGNFKESCGVDAYLGVDVTPLYIKHRPDSTDRKSVV